MRDSHANNRHRHHGYQVCLAAGTGSDTVAATIAQVTYSWFKVRQVS